MAGGPTVFVNLITDTTFAVRDTTGNTDLLVQDSTVDLTVEGVVQVGPNVLLDGTAASNAIFEGAVMGFATAPAVAEQAITGMLSAVVDPNAKAVLTSIIAALAAATGYGLVTNSTT